MRGRVTNEGRGVLVADDKGMQAYKDICRAVALANLPVKTAQSNDRTAPVKMSIDDSVAQSNGFTVPVKSSAAQLNVSASSLPLLAPHGCIIFQGTIVDLYLPTCLFIYLSTKPFVYPPIPHLTTSMQPYIPPP